VISHFHRTVFVHIPKCGGQSIESIFLSDLGLTWELRAPLLLRPNGDPRLGPPRLAHLLARDYARYHYLSDELFQSYYSFSVLRDPVARVISLFNYMRIVDPQQKLLSFDIFLHRWLAAQFEFKDADVLKQNASSNSFYFVRPQVDFITDLAGRVMVKDVFLLENIRDSFAIIKEKANLRGELEHKNKSTAIFRRSDLTLEHKEMIEHLYAPDFTFIAAIGTQMEPNQSQPR
jgi:hypothetical protein